MAIQPEHIDRAVAVARAHGAHRVTVFGSAVRTPDDARDLDLAIEGVEGWAFFGLVAALKAALPVPVDVVPLDQIEAGSLTEDVRRYGRVVFDALRTPTPAPISKGDAEMR